MLKAKYPYKIEKYDGDGIFECDFCHTGVMADLGFDVYAYRRDKNNTHRTLDYFGSYCRHCTEKIFCEPVSEPKLKHTPMTYNDIIHYLSYSLEKSSDEPDELTALNNLETDINSLIELLQSESPSQTPSQP